ncbi:MAG: hypothetical protein ACKOPI_08465 [bacterium]
MAFRRRTVDRATPRRPGVALLDAHVRDLCEEHDIAIAGASSRGRAIRYVGGGLEIAIPEIRGQVTYLIALHEIGHLVGAGRSAPRLEAEANAWVWALDHTEVEPTEASLRSIGKRLDGYLEWALARQHRKHPPRIPPPEHVFWRLREISGTSRGASSVAP